MTTLVVGALVCICIIRSLSFPAQNATQDAALYLQKFGYFGDVGSQTSALMTAEVISSKLRDFQRFSGLNETGVLDEKTKALMKIPRCGVTDNMGHASSARRKKRYALHGSKWRKTHLFYRISKYPGRLKDKDKVDKEIQKAFKTWGDVTPLIFEQRQRRGRASIDIRFEEDGHFIEENRFAGEGNTLAHAHFPESGGDIHFNDDKEWTIDEQTDDGVSLLEVATHELGHSLGLLHSDEKNSIMTPFYYGSIPKVKLDMDDIKAIQSLYGTREIYSEPAEDDPSGPSPDLRGAPNLCQDASIDTVTRTQNGNTYVFKGKFYWKVLGDGIANGYPRKISQDWGGLEGNLDASITWASGKTFFFKDGRYWRFTNREMDLGYPRLLNQGFEGIPDGPDAAFVWGGNGKTYFFKGDKYWRYDSNNDPPVSYKYPKPISRWNGVPTYIDAAFQFKNGRTYFFKGDKYYRFNDANFQVDEDDSPYPRLTPERWFKC